MHKISTKSYLGAELHRGRSSGGTLDGTCAALYNLVG
jgi:hypothetical protein